MPETSWPTLAVFCLFILACIGLAAYANRFLRRGKFLNAYFLGDRSLGPWALALTMAATSASGGSFVGFPGLIYHNGWVLVLWIASYMVVPITTIGVFGRRLCQIGQKIDAVTIPDILHDRFNSSTLGLLASLALAVLLEAYVVAQFVAGATILEVITAVPYEWGLVIFAVTVGGYTTYGGFRGVVWTDVLQGVVMFAGVAIMLPLAVIKAGGMENVSKRLAEMSPDLVTPPGPDNFLPLGMAISFFFVWAISGMGQPGQLVRLMAFKKIKTMKRAMFVLCIYFTVLYISLCLIFLCARVILPPLDQPDQAMPIMAVTLTGKWMSGFLVAAPFAAVMSTVSSYLLIISSSLIRDIVQKSVFPDISETGIKRGSFAATALAGVIALLLAFDRPDFLQKIIIFAGTALASTFLVPVAMTLYFRRANGPGTIAALLTGFVSVVLLYNVPALKDFMGFHAIVWALLASAVVGYVVTMMTPPLKGDLVAFYFDGGPRPVEPRGFPVVTDAS